VICGTALIIHLPRESCSIKPSLTFTPSEISHTVLHRRIAELEEILLKRAINVSFKPQVLLFTKKMSIGAIFAAFSLADLYGKGLAAGLGLDWTWPMHFVSSLNRLQRVKVYCLCFLHGRSTITLRQMRKTLFLCSCQCQCDITLKYIVSMDICMDLFFNLNVKYESTLMYSIAKGD